MAYPTTFTDNPENLADVTLSQAGVDALAKLKQSGFEVVAGVRMADVPYITGIAQQQAVREQCPNDLAKRFGNREMMEHWLGKNGGRGVFILREIGTKQLRGYGWAGLSQCDQLPEYANTFAVRLDEQVGGRGLGTPFVSAIFAGSKALYGTSGIWGETWGSNVGAVKTYLRVGAVLVSVADDWRPTLGIGHGDVYGKRRDVRLLLKFPGTLN
jgi:hypothetical protein